MKGEERKGRMEEENWFLVTAALTVSYQGRLHKGEWCEMHHGENWGNCVMIMMLLLVSIIIYYYMNTFSTLQQCTFNLLLALFLHCVLKNILDVFSYNSQEHCRIFIIFGRNITEKVGNQKMLYFPTSTNQCFCTTLRKWKHGNLSFSRERFMLICP